MDDWILSKISHRRSADTAHIKGDWWDTIPREFWSFEEPFELGKRQSMKVRATAAVDVATRTFAASMVAGLALPLGFSPREIKHLADDAKFYSAFVTSGRSTEFFVPPVDQVRMERRPPRAPFFKPRDGVCEDLYFESPFVALNPRLQKRFRSHEKNRYAHARYWRHSQGPRPTIVAIHGFSADLYALNEWFFALPWLYRMGCDILLMTMPFHGRRQEPLSPFSGHGFFAGGVAGINEAFAQGVCDFRVFSRFLRQAHGVEKLGVTGVSLGGYTASLLASLESDLEFAIPNVPLVSVFDVAMTWAPIGTLLKPLLRLKGISEADARRMLAMHSPLTFQPKIPRDRLFIIGGVGDRLAPPSHSVLLWEHWQRCRIHWFAGSHLLHLDKGAYLRQTGDFLREIGFINPFGKPGVKPWPPSKTS